MRKSTFRLLALGAVTLLLSAPSPASAQAPIHECGNYGTHANSPVSPDGTIEARWHYEEPDGAGIWNVTSRVVPCREARRVVLAFPGRRGRVRGLNCRYLRNEHEYVDVRCTGNRGRVVRWQAGA